LQKGNNKDSDFFGCSHKNLRQLGGFFVCQDCGLTIDEDLAFEKNINLGNLYTEAQREYERKISSLDIKAKQDPKVAHRYQKIKTLEKWFRDYQTSFHHQKKTIDLIKSYEFNITHPTLQEIKKRYLKYNKNHRKTYQNMVIIFLAIVWTEIKETTNKRIEQFIDVCNELGHKISKKMLSNAMEKINRTEKKKSVKERPQIEKAIKNKIKLLLEKDLNNIPFKNHPTIIPNQEKYDQLKMSMLLLASNLLDKISYKNIRSLNYKAFTAGFIYFLGQSLDKEKRKLFTQSIIEEATTFSSTTIRKKYHILKEILGDPKAYRKL
jgi:hypothetical protein